MTSYLTITDVCALLNVSSRTVHEWMTDKKLPFFRVGRVVRFHPAAVEAFIERRTIMARRTPGVKSVSGSKPATVAPCQRHGGRADGGLPSGGSSFSQLVQRGLNGTDWSPSQKPSCKAIAVAQAQLEEELKGSRLTSGSPAEPTRHSSGEQRDSAVAGKTRGGVSVEVREGNGKCAVASPAINERRAA